MPVTTSYPGVYIEELPSSTHTVTAAPTSITVFVGYTNPFWLRAPDATPPPFGVATEIFSFADYQALYGGFFNSPWLPDYMGQAVFEFFQNGGSDAIIVALQAGNYFDPTKVPPADDTGKAVVPATAVMGTGANNYTLTALQPVGLAGPPESGLTMQLIVSNLIKTTADDDTADVTLVYGSTVETYRRLLITDLLATINARSALALTSQEGDAAGRLHRIRRHDAVHLLVRSRARPDGDQCARLRPRLRGERVARQGVGLQPDGAAGPDNSAVLAEALAYCEDKRAFYIMDPPANAVADTLAVSMPGAPAGADTITDIWDGGTCPSARTAPSTSRTSTRPTWSPAARRPLRRADSWPGSSRARTRIAASGSRLRASRRRSWARPASFPGATMTDPQQGVLNNDGINVLRTFPGIGTVVFGARTLVSDEPGVRAVEVRRCPADGPVPRGLAVREPGVGGVRAERRPALERAEQEVEAFMLGLFRQGAFQGSTADQAFQVTCDSTTTSQADIDNGIVKILVAFAPLKPAEFVVIQIAQLAGQSQS